MTMAATVTTPGLGRGLKLLGNETGKGLRVMWRTRPHWCSSSPTWA
jgi:hypothetical protein